MNNRKDNRKVSIFRGFWRVCCLAIFSSVLCCLSVFLNAAYGGSVRISGGDSSNDGQGTQPIQNSYNDTLPSVGQNYTLPNTYFTIPGYRIIDWYCKDGKTGEEPQVNNTNTTFSFQVTSLLQDLLCKPKWGKCTCTEGTGVESDTCNVSVSDNQCVYDWRCNSGYQPSVTPPYTLTLGTSYTANCEPIDYGIFYLNMGSSDIPSGITLPNTYNVESSTITIPELTPSQRPHETFVGWCEWDSVNNTYNPNTCSLNPAIPAGSVGHRYYYARWSCDTGYTTSFNVANNYGGIGLDILNNGTSASVSGDVWSVVFGNNDPEITLSGIGMCSDANAGYYPYQFVTTQELNDAYVDGYKEMCWCKLSGYSYDGESQNLSTDFWVYNGGTSHCTQASCQAKCLEYTKEDINDQRERLLFASNVCEPNRYHIIYNQGTQTATMPDPDIVYYGDAYTLAAAPSATGYVFTGWSCPGLSVNTLSAGATGTYNYTGDVTCTAQWTPCSCTNGNHSTCGNTASVSNNTCSYDFTCDTHYNYNGESGGTVPASAAGVESVQAPDCSPITHTITVDRNRGSGDIIVNNGGNSETVSGNINTFTCNEGDTVTFPNWGSPDNLLTKTNNVFTGWDTSTFTCSADTTVTAQWATCSCFYTNQDHVASCPANSLSISNNTCSFNFTCETNYNYNNASGGTATGSAGDPKVTAGSCGQTTHEIIFKTGATELGRQTCNHGTTVDVSASAIPATTTTFHGATMPVDSAYGWRFSGWATSNNVATPNTTYVCNADITLYGIWNRTIQYRTPGFVTGKTQYYRNTTTSAAILTSVNVIAITSFASESNGWTPQGWADSASSTTVVDNDTTAHSVSLAADAPDEYYAVYKRTPKIVYDGNGSTGGSTSDTTCIPDQIINAGGGVTVSNSYCTLANNGFAKTDYHFDTWYTNAAGTGGTSYAAGASYTFPNNTWESSDTVTLYAKWTINQLDYTITYDLDNGSWPNNPVNPNTYNIGTPTFTISTPTKTGYVFDKWCEDAALTTNCESTKTITTGSTGDRAYYAKFEPETYNITYHNTDAADGVSWANQNDNPSTYTYGTGATIGVPSRTRYTFAGWCRGTVVCYNYAGTEDGYTITTTDLGNIDLYAVWIPHNVNLVWDSNGGTEINTPDSCEFDGTIENILQPTKTGYSFAGWVLKCWLPDTIVSERANAWAGRGLNNNAVHSWGGVTASTYGITQRGQWGASWNSGDKVLGEAFCSTTNGAPDSTASVIEMTEGVNCWCRLTSYTSNNAQQCDVMPTIWVHNGYSYNSIANCKSACDRACTNSMVNWDVGFRAALVGNNVALP